MEKGFLPELTRRNLSEEVYDALRRGILAKHFAPGERLQLDEIEEQLGVSRTPLKVALDRLAAEGLVEVKARRGTFVTENTPEDTADAFDVRRILEVYASELVAERATDADLAELRRIHDQLRQRVTEGQSGGDRFYECIDLDHALHQKVMDLARSSRLKEAWQQVNVHVQMARVRNRDAERVFTQALQEHARLLDALDAHDREGARQAMDAHLRRAMNTLLADMAHGL